jgi:hypothetical protein
MKIVRIAAVLAVVGFALPQPAEGVWSDVTCTGGTLNSCVGFSITQVGTTSAGLPQYHFTVTYLSSNATYPGAITTVGLYDLRPAPNFVFTDVALVSAPDGKDWSASADNTLCTQLAGEGVASPLFEACSKADPPPVANGITLGQSVTFGFTSSVAITLEHMTTHPGGLAARAHIQALGEQDCSIKLDSRNGPFSGPADLDACGTTTTVPEPTSMILIGSGLAGIGVLHRRRRKLEVQDA